MKLKSIAIAAAFVSAAAPAFAVGVFNEFTVDETVVPGSPGGNSALVADKLNGSYQERLTITGPNTFSAQAVATFTSFLADDGTTDVESLLQTPNSGGGYRLYAIFNASGNITGPNAFQSTNNSFSLYIDADRSTTFTLTDGLTAPVRGGDITDDILLATAGPTLSLGTGNLNGPPGAFNIDWADFALTDFGKTYFSAPNPFYLNVRVNGDYDIVNGASPGQTVSITGDVSAVFAVPEPGSLALAGLALAGLGALSRRRAAKQA